MNDTFPQKPCEWCGEIIPRSPSDRFPSIYLRNRFCNHRCAAQWRARGKRVQLTCEVCGAPFEWLASQPNRRFCSSACYFVHHQAKPENEGRYYLATPQVCEACGQEFFVARRQRYCSRQCVPLSGEANPNFGNHALRGRKMPLEQRAKLMAGRLGDQNPNWAGGSTTNGLYRMHTRATKWAREHLGTTCVECGEGSATLHHVVARRFFQHAVMAHFRENFVMLCPRHHRLADAKARQMIREGNIRSIPFADQLQESILDQLARDGLVSVLPSKCDLSPLGIEAGETIPDSWLSDKAA
jgi:hypothetical protein